MTATLFATVPFSNTDRVASDFIQFYSAGSEMFKSNEAENFVWFSTFFGKGTLCSYF